MRHCPILRVLCCAALLQAAVPSARAEEFGSGHYIPGQTASFMDALPGKPGPALLSIGLFYDGGANVPFPIAGLVVAGVDATIWAESLGFVYQFEKSILGGSYAAGFVLPLLTLEVSAGLLDPIPLLRVDDETGLGDMLFYPLMLGWKHGDLKYDLRLGVYAPTGDFSSGKLANLGKNYWTFEPGISASWLSTKIGTEVSVFTGFDINTNNDATSYDSGSSWHFELTLAQHLPLFGGFLGAGANTFLYWQITDDSGTGTKLGAFKGHAVGIGPVVSYAREVGKVTLAVEGKWLPELDVENRLEGDYGWLKIGLIF